MNGCKLFPFQRKGVERMKGVLAKSKAVLLADEPGLGKGLAIDHVLPTIDGMGLEMGKIKVGDKVIGSNGKPTTVTGVFPQGMQDMYRLRFLDGSTVDCDGSHLWNVTDYNRLRRIRLHGSEWMTMSAKDLYESRQDHRGKPRWRIPVASAVERPRQKLPIDPYDLGFLLADGHFGNGVVASVGDADQDIIEMLVSKHGAVRKKPGCTAVSLVGLQPAIRELGLKGSRARDKFIPECYFNGSIPQRTDLLRGMMDGDGSCRKNRVTYHTISPSLAHDLKRLVSSLGGIAKVRRYDRTDEGKGVEYQVNIRTMFCPFYCLRKKGAWSIPGKGREPKRTIKSIEKLPDRRPTVCIKVDAPDSLFLCGDDHVVTHNTAQAITCAMETGCKRVLILCPATLRFVWANESPLFGGPPIHMPVTRDPEFDESGWNVVSYSVAWNEKHRWIRETEWDMVILDESHYCKSYAGPDGPERSSSKIGLAVYDEIIPNAKRVVFLSGTPMPSRPIELYGMAQVMNPGYRWFESYYRFGFRYTGYGSDNRGSSNLQDLRTNLRPFIIRRHKKDVLKELPPKTLKVVALPQTAAMRKVLDRETGEITASSEAIAKVQERMDEARETGSLKELEKARSDMKSTWDAATKNLAAVRNELSVPKADASAEYVKLLLESGVEKVVVFFWHKAHADILQDKLERYGIARIDGETPTAKRGMEVEKFQKGSERVFLGQLRAAGTGITLTAASHVVISEIDWVPANISQAIDRCHRIGQFDNVTAHLLAVADSPDPMLLRALVKKIENIRQVIDGTSAPDKRKISWFGRGADPKAMGAGMNYDQKRWAQRNLYRLHRITEKGSLNDGVGLSNAYANDGRKLALSRVPTSEQYGHMLLILCRFHRQIEGGLPADIVDVVKSALDGRKAST